MHKISSIHYHTNHLMHLIDDYSVWGTCYILDIDVRKSPEETPLFGWPFMMKHMRKLKGNGKYLNQRLILYAQK